MVVRDDIHHVLDDDDVMMKDVQSVRDDGGAMTRDRTRNALQLDDLVVVEVHSTYPCVSCHEDHSDAEAAKKSVDRLVPRLRRGSCILGRIGRQNDRFHCAKIYQSAMSSLSIIHARVHTHRT